MFKLLLYFKLVKYFHCEMNYTNTVLQNIAKYEIRIEMPKIRLLRMSKNVD